MTRYWIITGIGVLSSVWILWKYYAIETFLFGRLKGKYIIGTPIIQTISIGYGLFAGCLYAYIKQTDMLPEKYFWYIAEGSMSGFYFLTIIYTHLRIPVRKYAVFKWLFLLSTSFICLSSAFSLAFLLPCLILAAFLISLLVIGWLQWRGLLF